MYSVYQLNTSTTRLQYQLSRKRKMHGEWHGRGDGKVCEWGVCPCESNSWWWGQEFPDFGQILTQILAKYQMPLMWKRIFGNYLYSVKKQHKTLTFKVIQYLKRCFNSIFAQGKEECHSLPHGKALLGIQLQGTIHNIIETYAKKSWQP